MSTCHSHTHIAVLFGWTRNRNKQIFIETVRLDEPNAQRFCFKTSDWPLSQHDHISSYLKQKGIDLAAPGVANRGVQKITLTEDSLNDYLVFVCGKPRFRFGCEFLLPDESKASRAEAYSTDLDPKVFLENFKRSHKKLDAIEQASKLVQLLPDEDSKRFRVKRASVGLNGLFDFFLEFYQPKFENASKKVYELKYKTGSSLGEFVIRKVEYLERIGVPFKASLKLIMMDLPDSIVAFLNQWPAETKKKLLAVCAMYDEGTELAEVERARAAEDDSFPGLLRHVENISIDEPRLTDRSLPDSQLSDSQQSDDNQFEDANEFLESTSIQTQKAQLSPIAEDSGERLDSNRERLNEDRERLDDNQNVLEQVNDGQPPQTQDAVENTQQSNEEQTGNVATCPSDDHQNGQPVQSTDQPLNEENPNDHQQEQNHPNGVQNVQEEGNDEQIDGSQNAPVSGESFWFFCSNLFFFDFNSPLSLSLFQGPTGSQTEKDGEDQIADEGEDKRNEKNGLDPNQLKDLNCEDRSEQHQDGEQEKQHQDVQNNEEMDYSMATVSSEHPFG